MHGSARSWLCSVAITFFYAVVVGWCIYYFLYVLMHALPVDLESSRMIWDSYRQVSGR
ncbi:MAG: hypothetical protein R2744_11275 [Bacteroidales bacterium]